MATNGDKRKRGRQDWITGDRLPYEMLPAYKAAYDCCMECQKGFAGISGDSRGIAREIKAGLKRVMVCIARIYLGMEPVEAMKEALSLSLGAQISIRMLKDTHSIDLKRFAQISRHSDSLVRQLTGWSRSQKVWDTPMGKKTGHDECTVTEQEGEDGQWDRLPKPRPAAGIP